MYKYLIFLIVFFGFSLRVCAQGIGFKVDPNDEEIQKVPQKGNSSNVSLLSHDFSDNSYTYIGYSDNTPSEKFSNAKSWIAKSFGDYKRVVQFEDVQKCKIVLKGKLPPRHDMDTKRTIPEKLIIYYLNTQMEFTLSIESKDNKYRLKFEDIMISCQEEKEIKLKKSLSSSTLLPMNVFCNKYEPFALTIKYDLQKLVDSAVASIEKKSDTDDW